MGSGGSDGTDDAGQGLGGRTTVPDGTGATGAAATGGDGVGRGTTSSGGSAGGGTGGTTSRGGAGGGAAGAAGAAGAGGSAAATGPCAGLCRDPVGISLPHASMSLGSDATCQEGKGSIDGGNCGNFVAPRTFKVNGVTEPCDTTNWTTIPPRRNGGYCFQASAGSHSFAYFTTF